MTLKLQMFRERQTLDGEISNDEQLVEMFYVFLRIGSNQERKYHFGEKERGANPLPSE